MIARKIAGNHGKGDRSFDIQRKFFCKRLASYFFKKKP
jgi:hypothetical protein